MPTRRDWLKGAAGLLVFDAHAQGRLEQGIRDRSGDVRVGGDRIQTGADGRLIIVVGRDVMLVRRSSSLNVLANGFRLVTGAVLTVFSPGRSRQLTTPTATIGIRGTAVYVEAERARTYVCTCYGETVLEPADDPKAAERVRPARRHGEPRFIAASGTPRMVAPAPMRNHTEAEIELLESLRGRR